MKRNLALSLLILLSLSPKATLQDYRLAQGETGQPLQAEVGAWEEIKRGFQEHESFIQSGFWTLTHGAESRAEVEEIFRLFAHLTDSFTRNDLTALREIGGVRGFKEAMARLLRSEDDVVRGFAATTLGISRDRSYAPRIAELLNRRDRPQDDSEEWQPPISSRGRAATALGLLGASEYAPRMLTMLRSGNGYDRSGAAMGLGYLRAREHAGAVAGLLNDGSLSGSEDPDGDAETAIFSLVEMGAATEYADEIARVMHREFVIDASVAAAYALARIRATAHASGIARLLTNRWNRGEAAIALAVMGANEYAPRIASLLRDDDALVRKDALIALGAMGATQFATDAARLLNDRENFVRYYAAVSLVLMDARGHAREAIPVIESAHRNRISFNEGDFHPLVIEDYRRIRARFERSLRNMSSQN